MPSAPYLPQRPRHMPEDTTMPSGLCCEQSCGERATATRFKRDFWPLSQRHRRFGTHTCPRSAASYGQLFWGRPRAGPRKRRTLVAPARPGWSNLPAIIDGTGDWQYHASRTFTGESRERVVMPSLPPFVLLPSSRAQLRSQAGRMPEHGSQLYPAEAPPPSHSKRCSRFEATHALGTAALCESLWPQPRVWRNSRRPKRPCCSMP